MLTSKYTLRRFVSTLAPALALTLAGCSESSSGGDLIDAGGPTSTSPVSVDFGLRRDVQIGPGLLSDAVTVDVNGDGLPDLLECNFALAQVSIGYGNALGGFTPAVELSTLGAPWRMRVTDLGGDGMLDIAVVCLDNQGAFPNGVQVFEQGPAAGEFTRVSSIVTRYKPIDLDAAFVGGVTRALGPQELFVADRDGGRVLRYELDGAGGLTEVGVLSSAVLGGGKPISVAVLDVADDGYLDLAVGEIEVNGGASTDRVVVYPRSDEGFGDPVVTMSPVFSPLVENAGDVDGNGFDDLSVSQLSSDTAFLLAADGAGFSRSVQLNFDGSNTSIVFEDMNDDGLKDVASTILESSTVSVQLATGPFQWGEEVRYNVGNLPRALGCAFLPGDDIPDLVCANADDFSILIGTGGGAYRGARGYVTSEMPVSVVVGDFDNDGDTDAAAVAARQLALLFFEGDGAGGLDVKSVVPLPSTDADEDFGFLASADIDKDGMLDVVASIMSTDEVRIYRNKGAVASFTAAPSFDTYQVGDQPTGIEVADFNGDTEPDLIVGNSADLSVQVLLGIGNGELQVQDPIALGSRPSVIRAMDVNNDGFMDVVVSAGGAGTDEKVIVLRGAGDGTLTSAAEIPVDTPTASMDFGDLDGNGLVDFAVGQPGVGGTDIFVVMNNGGFSFSASPLTIGPDPSNVLIADVDQDGELDVMVVSATHDLKIAYGDGTGGTREISPGPGEFPVPYNTQNVQFRDLNGDGLRDLIMVSPDSPLVWVGLNLSVPLDTE